MGKGENEVTYPNTPPVSSTFLLPLLVEESPKVDPSMSCPSHSILSLSSDQSQLSLQSFQFPLLRESFHHSALSQDSPLLPTNSIFCNISSSDKCRGKSRRIFSCSNSEDPTGLVPGASPPFFLSILFFDRASWYVSRRRLFKYRSFLPRVSF